jgi:hypothetical protein
MKRQATISRCGKYRYTLTRIWDGKKPMYLFIGLNPSTADAYEDDPTIRKLIKYVTDWGGGGFTIVNIFAWRSSDPSVLRPMTPVEAMGPENMRLIEQALHISDKVICMWGTKAVNISWVLLTNVKTLIRRSRKPTYCFELSNDGHPKHPLFLAGDLKPIKYSL